MKQLYLRRTFLRRLNAIRNSFSQDTAEYAAARSIASYNAVLRRKQAVLRADEYVPEVIPVFNPVFRPVKPLLSPRLAARLESPFYAAVLDYKLFNYSI